MNDKKSTKSNPYFLPILEVLKELGGSGSAAEVCDRVIEKLGFSEIEVAEVLPSGQPKVRNGIQWARHYLVLGGLLDKSQKGVWSLTKTGMTAAVTGNEVSVHGWTKDATLTQLKSKQPSSPMETMDPESSAQDQSLIKVLQSLPADGFERVCQRLLREAGFQQVTVTGRSGDGGIDGFGILEVNPLVSFNVLFQCKRYQGSVSSPQIRDFRGAMQGRADKGIVLTTGTFTADAKKEARRDGAPPIEIVDGEKLVAMFEKFGLGVIPRTVFEVDTSFFDGFR